MAAGWNIRVISPTVVGREKAMGKICSYRGETIYHYWASSSERRMDIRAWGLRESVLAHCEQNGVWNVFIYDKDEGYTYGIGMGDIKLYGIPGKTDSLGATINVPMERFQRLDGRLMALPFIPDSVYKILNAADRWKAAA